MPLVPVTPWLEDPDVRLYHGDCLDVLRELPSSSVHMCATSPPFYGLRDYGTEGQIGLEDTPDQWVQNLVAVFREVRRVLRDDGTLWVEIGDSYSSGSIGRNDADRDFTGGGGNKLGSGNPGGGITRTTPGHKSKDLLGQPWLLAFALRADGWWLRSEIIWARPNPMPESVTDRPTKSHSTVFLLSKQPRYFYDADAIREPHSYPDDTNRYAGNERGERNGHLKGTGRGMTYEQRVLNPAGANARSVWNIPTQPTPYAHFATWPEALVRRMILAGTSEKGCCPECGAAWVRETETTFDGDITRGANEKYPERKATAHNPALAMGRATPSTRTLGWSPSCTCEVLEVEAPHGIRPDGPPTPVPCTVLDPFAGSATTNLVARNTGRHSIGIELNESYLHIAGKRLQQLSLLAEGAL
jgi:DNA modification methylase